MFPARRILLVRVYGKGGVMANKIYCTNCSRQVIDRADSTDLYVGGGPVTKDVNGVICHECIADENAFYALLEGEE